MARQKLQLIQVKKLPTVHIRSKYTYLLTEKDGDKLPYTLWNWRNGQWNDVEEDQEESSPEIVRVSSLPGGDFDQSKIYLLTEDDRDNLAWKLYVYESESWVQLSKEEMPEPSIKKVSALPTENISEDTVYLLTAWDNEKAPWSLWNCASGKWQPVAVDQYCLLKKVNVLPTNVPGDEIDGTSIYFLMQADGDKSAFTIWAHVVDHWQQIGAPTPRYKVYTALLTQGGTNNVQALVLENTLGDITFERKNSGEYSVHSDYLFTSHKTFVYIYHSDAQTPSTRRRVEYMFNMENRLELFTSNSDGTKIDDVLFDTPIEIRVYE